MNLFNGALRRAPCKMAAGLAATGISEPPSGSPATRKWTIMIAASILLTGITLGIVYLPRPAMGDSLLIPPQGPPASRSLADELNLAFTAMGMDAPNKAMDYLDRAEAASDAEPWEIRFHRAAALTQMNRLAEALVLYQQVARTMPDDPRLRFNLAVTCDAMGRYAEALDHYTAVLRTQPAPSESDRQAIVRRIGSLRQYLNATQSAEKG